MTEPEPVALTAADLATIEACRREGESDGAVIRRALAALERERLAARRPGTGRELRLALEAREADGQDDEGTGAAWVDDEPVPNSAMQHVVRRPRRSRPGP